LKGVILIKEFILGNECAGIAEGVDNDGGEIAKQEIKGSSLLVKWESSGYLQSRFLLMSIALLYEKGVFVSRLTE